MDDLSTIRSAALEAVQAAADLGATPWQTFRQVTLPIIAPGVLAAALLTFALSLDDFTITYFNSGRVRTFPVEVFTQKRSRVPAQINVFGTMILLVAAVISLGGIVEITRWASVSPRFSRAW